MLVIPIRLVVWYNRAEALDQIVKWMPKSREGCHPVGIARVRD